MDVELFQRQLFGLVAIDFISARRQPRVRTDAQLQACSNASRLASKSSNGRRVHDHVWPDLAQAARHRGSIADIESHDV